MQYLNKRDVNTHNDGREWYTFYKREEENSIFRDCERNRPGRSIISVQRRYMTRWEGKRREKEDKRVSSRNTWTAVGDFLCRSDFSYVISRIFNLHPLLPKSHAQTRSFRSYLRKIDRISPRSTCMAWHREEKVSRARRVERDWRFRQCVVCVSPFSLFFLYMYNSNV